MGSAAPSLRAKSGWPTIPVYVLPATAAGQSAEVVERIVHQIVANDQRADLTDAQRARGIQQMLDAGVSQAKAAKKLSVGREAVKAAAAAARSTAAMDGLASGQLSLTEAAAIAEFEDDPTAVHELLRVAGTRTSHQISRGSVAVMTRDSTRAGRPAPSASIKILRRSRSSLRR